MAEETGRGKRARPTNDDDVAALETVLAEKRKKLQEMVDDELNVPDGSGEGASDGEEDEAIALYDSDSEAVFAMDLDRKPVMEAVSPPESQRQEVSDEGMVETLVNRDEKDIEDEQLEGDTEKEEPLQVTVRAKHKSKLRKDASREKHKEKHTERSGRRGRRRSEESSRLSRTRKDRRSSRERKRVDRHSKKERQKKEERSSERKVERQRSDRAQLKEGHYERVDRSARQSSHRDDRTERDGDSWRKERDLREELQRVVEKKEKEKKKEHPTEDKRDLFQESSESESDNRSIEEVKLYKADEDDDDVKDKQSEEFVAELTYKHSDISDEESEKEDEVHLAVEPAASPGQENSSSNSEVEPEEEMEEEDSESEVQVLIGAVEEEQHSANPKAEPDYVTYYPAISGCRSLEKEYEYLNRIEEGTYGVVYRARERRTNEIVALKKVKMEREKEGFPITSLREINMLLKSKHPNIVHVREIVVGDNMDKIYIVMEYVEHDLKTLMESMKQPFLVGETKTLMIQLLRAVQHLHDNWILHRDLKASNLLLSHKGILKVGDFGLAREYGSPLKNYTQLVVTLWYRAPELLLGTKRYSTAVDMWSVGCIFGELLQHAPMFPGKSEIDQINKIFKELGTPSEKIWPSWTDLPAVKKVNFAKQPYNNLRNRYPYITESGLDLLNKFLTYDPARRVTADESLKHGFFKESPLPVDPSMFPTWPAKSELPRARKHASPSAPKGRREPEDGEGADGDSDAHGFHMGLAKAGHAAKGAGFSLRF